MAKSKYRTDTRDSIPPPPLKPRPADKLGATPKNKIEVIDHLGRHRGMVGKLGTSATASRFLGGRGATLTRVKGRHVWKGLHP
jgi:hypothetical protein